MYELTVVEDKEEVRKMVSDFIKVYYQKNLISLFAEIQIVYETTPYAPVIEEVFLGF